MAVAVIGVIAVFFLWHGRLCAGRAGRAGASLQDHAGGARVAAEVRAVYGGFDLAIAGVLVFAAIADGDLRKGILITVGAALADMAFGRLAAAVLGDPTAFYPNWFLFLVELVAAGALLGVCAL